MANQTMGLGLDQIIMSLMMKDSQLSSSLNNMQIHTNALFRLLYEKKIINEFDIKLAIEKEFDLLYKLGHIEEKVSQETILTMVKDLVDFIKCDDKSIKESMAKYEEKMKQEIMKENSKIEVADAGVLNALDKANKGGKLIL